jgi:hypothetical protein
VNGDADVEVRLPKLQEHNGQPADAVFTNAR